MEEGEKEIGGKRGRGTRKVENREEENIGDRGEEWREEGVEYERECTLYSVQYYWEEESGGEG